MSLKKSRSVGRTTEITHIVSFKKGTPPGSHGIRYADRCRIVLGAFQSLEAEGFVSPVRRFSGIHFARWTLIDGDTRLLFTTNFDGTWEDYIGDFTREIPWSLGVIWTNCVDYPEDVPPAKKGDPWSPGAANYPLFSKFVHQYQIQADLFYAHYGHLTVRDVRHLQVFHEEAMAMLENQDGPNVTLGELQRRTMARQSEVEASYEGLPAGPFPHEDSLRQLSQADREIYARRIEVPVRELYGYDDPTMEVIMAEFGLQSSPQNVL